jgi:replicative superfamily II helicase
MATPDWEAIESAYRAGVLSLRDIGDKYGVTEGAIRKRAKKFDWVRKAVRRYAKMVRKVVRKRQGAYQRKACQLWPYAKKYATKS